jgi:ATP-dependent Clp protease, protease subunit
MAKSEKEKENQRDDFRTINDKIDNVLLESRRIFFFDAVDNATARDAIRKIWYLELTAPGKPITFVINSPGGSIDAGFSIWDQVRLISAPVTTLVSGLAASMGSVLCLCAAPGRRFATPYSRFMVHQPSISGVVTGQATDLDIQAKEIIKTKNLLVDLYMEKTGRSKPEIEKALDRDTWMSAREALDFGHIDKIIYSSSDL